MVLDRPQQKQQAFSWSPFLGSNPHGEIGGGQGLASYTDNAENAMGLLDSVLWLTPNSGMEKMWKMMI